MHFNQLRDIPAHSKGQRLFHFIASRSAVGFQMFHTDAWEAPEVHPSAAEVCVTCNVPAKVAPKRS